MFSVAICCGNLQRGVEISLIEIPHIAIKFFCYQSSEVMSANKEKYANDRQTDTATRVLPTKKNGQDCRNGIIGFTVRIPLLSNV